MELRHLKTFQTAAEVQSFTGAAKVLGLTQAAVSQHVAALERELSAELFDRAGRSVQLTDAGRRLHDYARRILELVEEARREMGGGGGVGGTVRIASSTVPAEVVLPALLSAFRSRYAEIRESLVISDSATAAEAVRSGEADAGFVGEVSHAAGLKCEPVAEDELVLVVPSGHRWTEKKRIPVKSLLAEPLLVREVGSGSRRTVEHALEGLGVVPHQLTVAMEINSNEAIRAAVARGMGAAFLSRALVQRDLVDGRLAELRVGKLRIQRRLYLVTDPRRVAAPAVRCFLEFASAWHQPSVKRPK